MGAKIDSGWAQTDTSSSTKQIIKAQSQHQLTVRFEKRKGKPVTVIGTFYYGEKSLKELHKKVKKSLACGGGIEADKNDTSGLVLVFQGDHREKIKPLLIKEGWKFRS